ncbi:MAG: tetratricopeptide repeat protein [Ignavibacteriales bacterium]|nr:tetratricopeptide repeat protein [Ignavibacteriales bacterium]
MLKKISILFFLLLSYPSDDCRTQTRSTSEIKFKLGQSYEQSNDLEQAVKFYSEAFSKDSSNNVYFDALKRTFLKLKLYPEAVNLMEFWLSKHRNDIGTIAQLGSAYVASSNEKKGIEIWEKAIEDNLKNESTYRIISSAATQSRMFDFAIKIMKRGRTEIGKPGLFATDIARLYTAVLNYASATHEYLDLLKTDPNQLAYIQMSIGTYTERADGLLATTQAVEEAVNAYPDNIQYRQLLAWLYMEGSLFEKAYDVYKILDVKLNAKGVELFNFAERAAREKAFSVSLKALEELIIKYPNTNYTSLIKFRTASILEEIADTGRTFPIFENRNPFSDTTGNSIKFNKSLEIYGQIVSQYSGTELAAKSLFRIGKIKKNRLNSLFDSKTAFENVIDNYGKFPSIVVDASLDLSDLFVAQNELQKAADVVKQILSLQNLNPDVREAVLLRAARNDYYNFDFQSALDKLNSLTSNSKSDVANDAISMKLFISEAKALHEDGLKEFVRAELLLTQRKESESLILFKNISETINAPVLQEFSLMKMGDIHSFKKEYRQALDVYDSLISKFPESILNDQVLMKSGLIQEYGLKNVTLAIETYQQLLSKFPNSIYSNEARKKIRELRGDNI